MKLDRVPAFDDWSAINRSLRAGDFFVTTGEILIRKCSVAGRGDKRELLAEVEWTFPLEFVEAVWGDGEKVGGEVLSATGRPPFFPPFSHPVRWCRQKMGAVFGLGFCRERGVYAAGAFALSNAELSPNLASRDQPMNLPNPKSRVEEAPTWQLAARRI